VLSDGARPVARSKASSNFNGKVRGLAFQRHGSSVQIFHGRVADAHNRETKKMVQLSFGPCFRGKLWEFPSTFNSYCSINFEQIYKEKNV